MKQSSARFENMPGLIRKQYLYNEEKGIGGGVYLSDLATATKDALTAIFANSASTDADDVFGAFA